jgi:hypothetical protein
MSKSESNYDIIVEGRPSQGDLTEKGVWRNFTRFLSRLTEVNFQFFGSGFGFKISEKKEDKNSEVVVVEQVNLEASGIGEICECANVALDIRSARGEKLINILNDTLSRMDDPLDITIEKLKILKKSYPEFGQELDRLCDHYYQAKINKGASIELSHRNSMSDNHVRNKSIGRYFK